MAGLHDVVAEIYQFIGDWVSVNEDTVWSLGDVWWRTNMLNGRRRELRWVISAVVHVGSLSKQRQTFEKDRFWKSFKPSATKLLH